MDPLSVSPGMKWYEIGSNTRPFDHAIIKDRFWRLKVLFWNKVNWDFREKHSPCICQYCNWNDPRYLFASKTLNQRKDATCGYLERNWNFIVNVRKSCFWYGHLHNWLLLLYVNKRMRCMIAHSFCLGYCIVDPPLYIWHSGINLNKLDKVAQKCIDSQLWRIHC